MLSIFIFKSIRMLIFPRIIEDPLEAFNKIMREKEMRRDRFKRSPKRYKERSRSPNFRQKSPLRRRKRSRTFSSSSSKSYSRSRSRSYERFHSRENRGEIKKKFQISSRKRYMLQNF